MLENVNEVSIVVSALLLLAIGSIWYSPLVFGTHWAQSARIPTTNIEKMYGTILQTIVSGLILNVCMLFVLAKLVASTKAVGGSLITLAVYLSVLLAGGLAFMVIWEKRSFLYYAIHAGYIILMMSVGIMVIGFWPW